MQDQVWISIDDYVIPTYQGGCNTCTVINNATLNLTKETRKEIPQSVASNLLNRLTTDIKEMDH